MADFYFSRSLDNDRAIFIAPLSDVDIQASGENAEDGSGYFLYQRCYASPGETITLLAHIQSEKAALEMCELLKMS